MTCDNIRDFFAEAFYNELDARRKEEFDHHVASCASCRREYDELKLTLALMNERTRVEPTDEEWKEFGRRLDGRLGTEEPQSPTATTPPARPHIIRRIPGFRPAWAYGIAAVLLVAFGIYMGRTFFNGNGAVDIPPQYQEKLTSVSPPGRTADSTDKAALVYLERSRNLLLGLTNLDAKQSASIDLSRQVQVSRQLYNQGNVLTVALNRPSQQQLRQLVQNLQIILLQLANMEVGKGTPAIELVRQGVDSKSILLKINLEAIRAGLNEAAAGRAGNKIRPILKLSEINIMRTAPITIPGSGTTPGPQARTMLRTVLLLAFLLAVHPAARSQEASAKAYEKAYGFILDERWKDANASFGDYVKKYPESDMIDAAHYWLCYTRGRLEPRKEVAFECYREFIGEYPESKWADDARSSMVGLASQLAREGKPEYEAMLKNLDESADEDVQLAALYALANMGSDKAFSTVVTLYDQTKSENIRSKIIYVLGSFDTKESRKKLTEIALNDKSTKVRRDAVYAIGSDDSPEVVEALKKIVGSKADVEVRKAAIYSLAGHSDGGGASIAYLGQIAATDPDRDVAMTATYALGEGAEDGTGKAGAAELRRIMKEAKSPDVKKAALNVLGNMRDKESIAAIKECALSNSDEDLRKTAAYALGNSESPEAFGALKELVAASTDPGTQEAALYSMGNIGGEQVEKYLYETAVSNPNDRVARTALFSLSNASNDHSSKLMLDIVKKAKSPEVRKQALYQIGNNSDDPEAVATLVKVAKESTDPEIQMIAIQTLGQTGNDDAVPVLKDFAKNGANKRVRSMAVTALGQIGTEKAKAALLEILGVK